MRTLACGPGSISTRTHVYLSLSLVLALQPDFFPGYSGSVPSTEKNVSKLKLDQDRGIASKPVKAVICNLYTHLSFIYLLTLPGKQGPDTLKVRNAGSKFGLNLVLDVQQDEYVNLLADQAGFMVLIHDQETPPMVEELGFAVGPGTTTFAAFKKQKVGVGTEHLRFISRWTLHEQMS